MTSRPHAKLMPRLPWRAGIALAAVAALLPSALAAGAVTEGLGCTDQGAAVHCELWAEAGTLGVPGGSVDVMGYTDTAGGAPIVPGPAIVADAGDTVEVVLHNGLGVPTGMLFQEQALAPDRTGVAAGGQTTYTFTATAAGTYLYEASPFVATADGGSQYQAAMGMSGALVVRPSAPGQAYDAAGSAFDSEHLVVVSELDTALTAGGAATYDMRKYAPDYFLVNGKASPDTASLAANAGDRVLLRWVNAGVKAHSVAVLGASQRVVGEDGNALTNPRDMVSETLGAGQTEDVVVALAATAAGRYPVYDAGLWLNNNASAGVGGALTFLDVTPGATGPDTAGPGTSGVDVTGATLSATVSDVATGGAGVTAAEYFVDTVGATGSGTAMTGTFGAPTVTVSDTIAPLAGAHAIYVRGQDANGNWGPVSSVLYVGPDVVGPLTKGISLSPDPGNGSKDVALGATGDDTGRGGHAVTDGEYRIDGGTAVGVASNGAGTVAAIDTTIPAADVAALAEGAHTVQVRSHDAAGNWGAWVDATLRKDVTGPDSSSATATPATTNGLVGISPTNPAVRVAATVTDPVAAGVNSTVAAGEGFIDTAGADGTGFPLVPADGAFGGVTETLRADIPLTTIASLPDGPHTVYLHGRDSSGNWGSTATTTITVDRTALNAVILRIATAGFDPAAMPQVRAATTGAGRVAYVAAANLSGTGTLGMRITLSGTIRPATPASAYLTDNTPAAESSFRARFAFNPNNSSPGGGANGIVLLAGYTADNGGGSTRFAVRYRKVGSARQVRLTVARSGGTTSTRWFTVKRRSASRIEVTWTAGAQARTSLRIDSALRQVLRGLDTGAGSRIESVRLGVQGLSGGKRAGSIYLDDFTSDREVGP